jgi:hypothetical protein
MNSWQVVCIQIHFYGIAVFLEPFLIVRWESFHDEFNRVFGFPDFYGRIWTPGLTACLTSMILTLGCLR